MPIFQKAVLIKYLKSIDKTASEHAYKQYREIFGPDKIGVIKTLKEEEYQDGFLRDLFVKVLGYTIKPDENYNLVREKKNETDAKKADGAIIKDGKVTGVIELKDTRTKDMGSITDQAFGYKNSHESCRYVITSNFHRLRFYIDNKVEYEEFDLFSLSSDDFALLYLILQKDNLLCDLPFKMKTETKHHDEAITRKLYKDYSNFKYRLYENMAKNNPAADKLTLFKKSQKLIDRFLFILFAEDSGLLPPNSIARIIQRFDILKAEDAYKPLYDIYKQYFGYMNKGKPSDDRSEEIPAYNGGLFYPDELLDSLIIDDEILRADLWNLSTYNFCTEVDVNILGHIFEHSLSDIEEITAELEGVKADKKKSRRKKDGVYYTPKYITQYIVENTVGALCTEKRKELAIHKVEFDEKAYRKPNGFLTDKGKDLFSRLEQYKKWLLTLKIVDPACGSGAFLNQALNFLITEHKTIDDIIAELTASPLRLFDTDKAILENNLYGVDINDESVEIAKLSLWLRTARKDRKLSDLNNNIKCGNSLINDPKVAGDKAFDWHKEFPAIMNNGGFDVVIGNPPYVGEKGHSSIFEDLKMIPKWKEYYRRRSNTYYFFIKLGIELLRPEGIQSLIIPSEFLTADWANKVRLTILKDTKIISLLDFHNVRVFQDAGTSSLIITHSKNKSNTNLTYNFKFIPIHGDNTIITEVSSINDAIDFKINQLDLSGTKPWNFYQNTVTKNERVIPLNTLFDISQGIVTGADKVTNNHIQSKLIDSSFARRGIFILSEGIDIKLEGSDYYLKISDKWIKLLPDEKIFIKPFIKTENLQKWYITKSNQYVIYIGNNELKGNIKNYLMQFSGILINRSTIIENKVITKNEFDNFSIDDIKENYSSAGAVQKIMRRRKWWLPFYERVDVPFAMPKIIVNTKNMDKFTFSDSEHIASGGGAGGQNFIYPILKDNYYLNQVILHSTEGDFVKYVNSLLNSKFLQKHIKDGHYNQLSVAKIGDLPVVKIDFTSEIDKLHYFNLIEIINKQISLLNRFNLKANTFQSRIKSNFAVEKISTKLESFHEYDFKTFVAELKKQKVSPTLKQQDEWEDYFNSYKKGINDLQAEIAKTDKEIDRMVYELYGLTEEEIRVVEGN